MRIWSVGHGARSGDDFLALLREAGIRTLADVRTVPRSRKHPQFEGDALAASVAAAGISYVQLPGLGGWRRKAADSPHVALRTPGFRNYADHMTTPEFARDYARLEALARESPTAFMCAETLWWRCHRRLVSDRLAADGWDVVHLIAPGKSEPHRLWEAARLVDGRLIYDRST